MSDSVTTTIEDGVAVVRIDDGKMNAIGHDVLDALHAALDRAESEAGAVCIVGNDRALSAGFDLSVMTAGPDSVRDLVASGARFLMRLYGHPQPTVVAVTGHALAAGALVVLACDIRIAADRPSKIGLNEVAIGMTLPVFGIELARDRLSKRYATRAVVQSEIFDPAGAQAAGYVDDVVARRRVRRAGHRRGHAPRPVAARRLRRDQAVIAASDDRPRARHPRSRHRSDRRPGMNPNGRVARVVQNITVTPGFQKVAPKVIPRIDRVVSRLSRGRFLLSSAMLPSLVLTTIGAKSGLPREAPLATVPEDDGSFYVVGSNYARESHPMWTGNLIANPQATVMFRGRTIPVTARLLEDEERAKTWPYLISRWPGWGRYEDVTDRTLRVFHLVPRDE